MSEQEDGRSDRMLVARLLAETTPGSPIEQRLELLKVLLVIMGNESLWSISAATIIRGTISALSSHDEFTRLESLARELLIDLAAHSISDSDTIRRHRTALLLTMFQSYDAPVDDGTVAFSVANRIQLISIATRVISSGGSGPPRALIGPHIELLHAMLDKDVSETLSSDTGTISTIASCAVLFMLYDRDIDVAMFDRKDDAALRPYVCKLTRKLLISSTSYERTDRCDCIRRAFSCGLD